MEIYKYLAANCSVRRNICLHVKFTITIRKTRPKFYLYDKTAKRNGKWSTGLLLFFTEWLMVINLCPFIFNVDISQKRLIMKILARCQFCLLTSAACLSMPWWQSYTYFPVIKRGTPLYVILGWDIAVWGSLKDYTFVTNQKGIEETFIHSVIHLLILSGSQSVS